MRAIVNIYRRQKEPGFLVKAARYLEGEDNEAFRRAIDGARWLPAIKFWSIREDQLIATVDRLNRADFDTRYPNEVADIIKHGLAVLAGRARDAAESLDTIESRLAERGHKLFVFQRRDVEFLASRSRVMNCNEQGLGKTIETLASLPYGAAVLVLCPKEAKGTWLRECQEWREDFVPSLLEGRKNFRLPCAHEMLIANFDILPDRKTLDTMPLPAPLFLIVDEFHKVKGWKAKRSQCTEALSLRASNATALSGTPLPNTPLELWSCLSVFGLEREVFGTFDRFTKLFHGKKQFYYTTAPCASCSASGISHGFDCPYCEGKGSKSVAHPAGWLWGVCPTEDTDSPCSKANPASCSICHGEAMPPHDDVPKLLSRVMVRHEKKDVLKDLPAKIYKVMSVPLDAKTIKTLNLECDVGKILAAETLEELQEIESLSRARAILAEAKIPFGSSVLDDWEASGYLPIAFSAHRGPTIAFGKRLGWETIIGGMREDRETIVKDFQAGKLRGLAGTIGAMSTSLTLTRATHELFVDRAWTPADNDQAEDRAHRIGQTAGLIVVDLVAEHPIDRHVHVVLQRKRGIIRASVGKIRGDRDLELPLIRAMERAK